MYTLFVFFAITIPHNFKKTTMKISQPAILAIKNNSRVKAKLMLAFDRSHRVVEYWITKNNLLLTTPGAIAIIKEETGILENEILTEK
jgi:hypothetical protein